MTDDAVTWAQLSGLLPPAEAEEFRDCWAIGEQEAGLGLLVSGVLTHGVAIGEVVRAQIAVLAETWGEREALTPRLLRCLGDGRPDPAVALLADGDVLEDGRICAGLVLVPWVGCNRCGEVLMRAHAREAWGGLSYLAAHYVIAAPDRAVGARVFSDEAAGEAFASLCQSCGALPLLTVS